MFFGDLFKSAKSKFEIITIFLALLELIKMKEVVIVQTTTFGDMEIRRNTESIKPSGGQNG